MNFRCAGIIQESIVDGRGIRMVVFCQGCMRHCKGCHNQHTWDPKGGYMENTDHVIEMYKKNPLLSGITISGGEPFLHTEPMTLLATEVHRLGGDVWLYTGHILDKILDFFIEDPISSYSSYRLLREVDVLVDGPFMLDKRDISLDWRGSSNQRVIDFAKFRKDINAFNEFCKDLDDRHRRLFASCVNIRRS